MKKINAIFLIVFALGICSAGFAEAKKEKNIQPDSPVVTTWSKIKELFE